MSNISVNVHLKPHDVTEYAASGTHKCQVTSGLFMNIGPDLTLFFRSEEEMQIILDHITTIQESNNA